MRFDYSNDLFPPALVLPAWVRARGSQIALPLPAKVDTGAGITVLPERIQGELDLMPLGRVMCYEALNDRPQQRQTYFVEMSLDRESFVLVEVILAPKARGLLGRDVINDYDLHAYPRQGYFELHRATNAPT